MKDKKYYEGGELFHKALIPTLKALKDRIDNNKASMLVIDGAVGEGKTTLAVHCANYLTKLVKGKSIDFSKQIAMGGEQFQEKLQMCYDSKLPVLIYDEAGDFDKRGALTKFNKQINRVFDTYRAYKILVIIVLPCFNVLDNAIFDKQIPRSLLHCYGRGKKHGLFKAYSLYRMYFLREKIARITVKPKAYGNTSPNYYGRFLDLDKAKRKELEKLSTSSKLNILSGNILNNKGLKNKKEIAKELGVSLAWVKKKIDNYKIKPTEKYKRSNYYDLGVIKRLEKDRVYS